MDQRPPHAPTSHKQSLGRLGETIAAEYLQRSGYEILSRNWRSGRLGELDLVIRDRESIIAVEVKTRGGHGYGTPFESITARKLARIRTLLIQWLHQQHTRADSLRIDAISVLLVNGEAPQIEHLRGIS